MTNLSIEFLKILLTSGLMFTLCAGRKTFRKARVLITEKFDREADHERTYCKNTS